MHMDAKFKTNYRMFATEKRHHWPQYVVAGSVLFLAMSVGLHFCWSSPAKLRLQDFDFYVSMEDLSYLIMISPMGYLIGCPVSAFLLDNIGRKSTLLVLAGPQILAWLLIANATGIYMIYVARLCAGISEGGALTSVPVYIGEISDAKIRGAQTSIYGIGIMLGCVLINVYGSYMTIKASAYFSIIVPTLFLLTFLWMPESPYFLIMNDKIENARKSLERLRWMNNVEEELNRLVVDVQRQISEPKSIKDIFIIKSNLKAFFILIALRTFQQFSGGASLNFYNQYIFQQAGEGISIIAAAAIFHASLAIVTASTTFIIDIAGRRLLLMISITGNALCLFAVGLYFSFQYYKYDISGVKWVPIIFMILYTVGRGAGLLNIPTVLAGELFSASVKAKAISIISLYFSLCMGGSSKLFHWLESQFGMHVAFFFFVIVCIIGVLFTYYCLPETKGKTLEEIQQQLRGEHHSG